MKKQYLQQQNRSILFDLLNIDNEKYSSSSSILRFKFLQNYFFVSKLVASITNLTLNSFVKAEKTNAKLKEYVN